MIAATFLTYPVDSQGNSVSVRADLVAAYYGRTEKSTENVHAYEAWTTVALHGVDQQVDCRVPAEQFGKDLAEALMTLATDGRPVAEIGPAR